MTTLVDQAKLRTEKWLEGVYKDELGRDLGDEGRKYWTEDIHDRGQTKDQVLANIRRSNEYAGYQRGKDKDPEVIEKIIYKDKEEKGGGKEGGRKGGSFVPEYDPKRRYNRYYDAVDSAADTGNRMTDDYYQRFLPQMRNDVLLGVNEIGAADRYHGDRYEGKPPTYTDPKELFDYYKNKTSDSDDNSQKTIDDLTARIKELEDKYIIK
tara:strand:+ start:285 stop:911 length:627 start_codon:yes stop_codon:yes gene_type:complete